MVGSELVTLMYTVAGFYFLAVLVTPPHVCTSLRGQCSRKIMIIRFQIECTPDIIFQYDEFRFTPTSSLMFEQTLKMKDIFPAEPRLKEKEHFGGE